MEIVSPSQLMPSEIHRMWTSSTPTGAASTAMAHPFCRDQRLLELQCVDQELLACDDLHVQAPAVRAGQREPGQLTLARAPPAAPGRGHLAQDELGALHRRVLRHELERELQRRGHDLAQMADQHLDAHDAPALGVPRRDLDDRRRQRQLVHQQILGRGSPTSWSITRRPPKPVSTRTMPGGSVRTSPSSAARSPPGTARSAWSAASACSGATAATSLPSLATYIGSMPRISHAPATAGSTGTAASRTTMATPEARASSLRTEATPPRVASRRQRSPGPAAVSSASTAGHSERV